MPKTSEVDGNGLKPEEKRAFDLLKKGDAALNRFGWFGLASGAKYDDAISFYTKAANTFKMSQSWQLAGETFGKLADLEIKANSSTFEASTNFINAGHMFRQVDTDRAIHAFSQGIRLLIDDGRFGIAAKHSESIAEIYESTQDLPNAIKYFTQAANFFNSDNSPSRANKNLEKIGLLQGSSGEYKEAFEAFDKLGKSSLESNLLKFNAKKHFLHSLLCLLARNDLVAVENTVTNYKALDYSFEDSRECKLIETLVDSVKNLDSDKFADVLYSYDSISKLNPWQTSILLKVKSSMQETAEEMPDLC